MLLSSTGSEHAGRFIDLREAMVHAAKTACFLMDHLINTAMLGRHRLSFRCMKRSRVNQDGALSRCTSLVSIVGGSQDINNEDLHVRSAAAECSTSRGEHSERSTG